MKSAWVIVYVFGIISLIGCNSSSRKSGSTAENQPNGVKYSLKELRCESGETEDETNNLFNSFVLNGSNGSGVMNVKGCEVTVNLDFSQSGKVRINYPAKVCEDKNIKFDGLNEVTDVEQTENQIKIYIPIDEAQPCRMGRQYYLFEKKS